MAIQVITIIVFISAVYVIVVQCLADVCVHVVKFVACRQRPSLNLAVTIHGTKEALGLAPD
jgi:hypothetical protein